MTYLWQTQDGKVLRRINALIRDVQRNGNEGSGNPRRSSTGFQG
jgi:toxin YoeB